MKIHKAQLMPSKHKQSVVNGVGKHLGTSSLNYESYVVYNGKEYLGTDCIGKLCRELDEGELHLYREGKYVGRVRDVVARGQLVLRETDKSGFRTEKYKPFSEASWRSKEC